MSDKLQYLGWGLIGTPKGRQQTSDGVDKQLNLAPSFDLEQQFGGCLPDPKLKDLTPLYRLSFQRVGQYPVLGLAEYRPIYEQGQTRAGSYFGAFVETVHHAFDENQSELLKNVLLALSSYQAKHFIDQQTNSYHEVLSGKAFDAPKEPLLQIVQQMLPLAASYVSQMPVEETLYVACDASQTTEALKLLLQQQLYYRFKQIFFSESEHINQQMRNKKIPILSFLQLKAGEFHLIGWKDEVRHLRGMIAQHQADNKQLSDQLKQEREQQNQLVETQLRNKMGEVNQQIAQYRQQAEQAEQRADKSESAAKFGRDIYQLISQNAQHLGSGELGRYATSNPLMAEIGNLRATMNDVRAHLSNLHQQSQQEPQVIAKTSVWTFIFGGLAGLFALILLSMTVMSWLSNDIKVPAQEYGRLKSERDNLKTGIAAKQGEIETLKNSLSEELTLRNELQNNLNSVCNNKSVKDKSECKK